jgi:hypothetical protein
MCFYTRLPSNALRLRQPRSETACNRLQQFQVTAWPEGVYCSAQLV